MFLAIRLISWLWDYDSSCFKWSFKNQKWKLFLISLNGISDVNNRPLHFFTVYSAFSWRTNFCRQLKCFNSFSHSFEALEWIFTNLSNILTVKQMLELSWVQSYQTSFLVVLKNVISWVFYKNNYILPEIESKGKLKIDFNK